MSEQLKQRILSYSASPPADSWEAVSSHLKDEKNLLSLRERVHNISVDPPDNSWNIIERNLGHAGKGRIKLVRPVARFVRAAAILAGIVIAGGLYFYMNGNRRMEIRSQDLVASLPSSKPISPAAAKITAPKKAGLSILPKFASLYSPFEMKKKAGEFNRRKLLKAVIREDDAVEIPEVSIPAKPIRDASGSVIQNALDDLQEEGYVSVTGPNGTQTRISAKFASLLLYLNGDDDTDQQEGVFTKQFLESLLWKSRFQSWKSTISKTAFIPSATNFLDILEFKDLILEHRDIN